MSPVCSQCGQLRMIVYQARILETFTHKDGSGIVRARVERGSRLGLVVRDTFTAESREAYEAAARAYFEGRLEAEVATLPYVSDHVCRAVHG